MNKLHINAESHYPNGTIKKIDNMQDLVSEMFAATKKQVYDNYSKEVLVIRNSDGEILLFDNIKHAARELRIRAHLIETGILMEYHNDMPPKLKLLIKSKEKYQFFFKEEYDRWQKEVKDRQDKVKAEGKIQDDKLKEYVKKKGHTKAYTIKHNFFEEEK